MDHHLTTWIRGLPHQPTAVFKDTGLVVCSMRAPKASPPLLCRLHYQAANRHLQKFSEDSALIGLMTDGDDRKYREWIAAS